MVAERDPKLALNASIAKFASLPRTKVTEQINVPWDRWLAFLAAEPGDDFLGQMDHPGWSPVIYSPPKRDRDNIKSVNALVLDYDKGATFDLVVALWVAHYGLVYTTKNHTDEEHRLRVVLPLSRPVTADEYDAIWRRANARSHAAQLTPDKQARDASRFWYDPTRPIGTWRAERLSGEVLDVEATLNDPVPDLQPRLAVVAIPKALTEDARVRRARAYLARMPGAVSGSNGHTATFNAVAHVMFGFNLDESTTRALIAGDYNPRCDPPWSDDDLDYKIASVARDCDRPRGYLLTERPTVTNAHQAAHSAPPLSHEISVDWRAEMLIKKDGTYLRRYSNTAAFIRHHPEFRGKWTFESMTAMPWFDGQPMQPTVVHEIRAKIEQVLGFTAPVADIEAAIMAAAHDRPFHPIQQYLRSLDWDGEPRLSSMARDYLGSTAAHHAEMIRRFMIGAVARVMRPGCKMDTALMLVGAQGIRKSTFFAVLGGTWHSDTFMDITSRDGLMALHSAWLYEFAELENIVNGRAESRLKAFMSSSHDTLRVPYAKSMESRARSVVICGTTNRDQFLTDDTGSRRFWIVPAHQRIDTGLLTEMRDQLWAEAVSAYEAGEPWWLDDDTAAIVEQHNEEHNEDDPWLEAVEDWVTRPNVTQVTTTELLRHAIGLEVARHDRWAQTRVGRIMKRLGWKRRRIRLVYLYQRPGWDECTGRIGDNHQ